ncbi:MAG TPA: BapA prefix-like domain-containing protein [Herbaspirillum sp.]|jgi:hypothetical protein
MTTIVKTINPANKAVEQIKVSGTAAPINVAPGAIVEVQAGRAQVASFIQNGKNLVLVMIDGTEIVLQGYFDNAEGAGKKLILVDDNGSVEVQFPTADGSTADGASVDVAPSYVTADADTSALLADSAAAATDSGVSPVLLGVLGAIGVGALAVGGGGSDDAPAASMNEPIVEGKTTDEGKSHEGNKEKPITEGETGDRSASGLVTAIKKSASNIVDLQSDGEGDVAQLAAAQKELLGFKSAVTAKIAELAQSTDDSDIRVNAELKALDKMLDSFSLAAEKEAQQIQTLNGEKDIHQNNETVLAEMEQASVSLNDERQTNMDELAAAKEEFDTILNNLNDTQKETVSRYSDAQNGLKSAIIVKEEVEKDVGRMTLALEKAVEEMGASVDSVDRGEARTRVNEALKNQKLVAQNFDAAENDVDAAKNTLDSAKEDVQSTFDYVAKEIDSNEFENFFLKSQIWNDEINALKLEKAQLDQQINEVAEGIAGASKHISELKTNVEQANADKLDTLSPATLMNEIDALQDAQGKLDSSMGQVKTLMQAATDEAKEIAAELRDATKAYEIASDAYYKTTGIMGLGRGDAAKLVLRELANDRLKEATEHDVEVKESIALLREIADRADIDIKSNSEQIAQKEAELHAKLTVDEDSRQIVESQPELPAKILGDIVQLEQTSSDMNAAAFKAKDLLQQALHDAEQPAAELKEAKDAFDIVGSHETRANAKIYQPTEERLNLAEVADALAKETVSDAQHVANEIDGSIKAISEEVAQKFADFDISAKFYGVVEGGLDIDNDGQNNNVEAGKDGDTAAEAKPSLSDLAKDLFSENTDSSVPSPSTGSDYDAPAALQDSFADQPQLIVQ